MTAWTSNVQHKTCSRLEWAPGTFSYLLSDFLTWTIWRGCVCVCIYSFMFPSGCSKIKFRSSSCQNKSTIKKNINTWTFMHVKWQEFFLLFHFSSRFFQIIRGKVVRWKRDARREKWWRNEPPWFCIHLDGQRPVSLPILPFLLKPNVIPYQPCRAVNSAEIYLGVSVLSVLSSSLSAFDENIQDECSGTCVFQSLISIRCECNDKMHSTCGPKRRLNKNLQHVRPKQKRQA